MQKFDKSSGFSLVSVLLAAGMMGVIAGGFSNMMINQNKSAKHLENRIDLQAIKRRIIEQLDCKKTLGINSSGNITTCSNNMLEQHGHSKH